MSMPIASPQPSARSNKSKKKPSPARSKTVPGVAALLVQDPAYLERQRTLLRFAELLRTGRRVMQAQYGSQTAFALRLGVSRRTLQRMEKGDPGIAIDVWMRAWQVLGMMRTVISVITPSDSMATASAAAVAAHAASRPRRPDEVALPPENAMFPGPAPRPMRPLG